MNFDTELKSFSSISLKEMDAVMLLNRQDSKFLFKCDKLKEVLTQIKLQYKVLQIDDKRSFKYDNLYFDTNDFLFYSLHHNGKLNRHKVRFRKYLDTDINFLEVKFKNNKGKTKKSRVQARNLQEKLTEKSKNFIASNNINLDTGKLNPKLWVYYQRTTFVNKKMSERLTIDLNLKFKNYATGVELSLPHLVILEVKQDRLTVGDNMLDFFREKKMIASSFSKYCMGINLLYPEVKHNNFKKNVLFLNKMHDTDVRHTISK